MANIIFQGIKGKIKLSLKPKPQKRPMEKSVRVFEAEWMKK